MSPALPSTLSRERTAVSSAGSQPYASRSPTARRSNTAPSAPGVTAITRAGTTAGTVVLSSSLGGTSEYSAGHVLEGVAKGTGLVCGQLNDEPATAFERHPHHDAAPLFGDLERAIARPRLHGRHARSLSGLTHRAKLPSRVLTKIIAGRRGQKETVQCHRDATALPTPAGTPGRAPSGEVLW